MHSSNLGVSYAHPGARTVVTLTWVRSRKCDPSVGHDVPLLSYLGGAAILDRDGAHVLPVAYSHLDSLILWWAFAILTLSACIHAERSICQLNCAVAVFDPPYLVSLGSAGLPVIHQRARLASSKMVRVGLGDKHNEGVASRASLRDYHEFRILQRGHVHGAVASRHRGLGKASGGKRNHEEGGGEHLENFWCTGFDGVIESQR